MKNKRVEKLIRDLSADYFVFAPQKLGADLAPGYEYGISEVKDINNIDWSGRVPYGNWKEVLLPHHERLFDLKNGELIKAKANSPLIACLGMNILDLKALTLFEQVFANDVYYQERRRNLLIIGYSTGLPNDYKKNKVFSHNYKEDILEHVVFDIFITSQSNGKIALYSGSEKGQKILEKYGLGDYQHIEFSGPVAESGPDKRMASIAKKMENSFNHPVWDDLNKRCIACSKCTIACPTCFCFDLEDRNDPADKSRSRKWSSCFNSDFTLIAGGQDDLDTVKKKIFFWYFHKFVRIPKEYSLPGCVGCNRCTLACPVGIDINKTIQSLMK
ncbi:MAG: 4Fe-4S dicluster domain-containing protein [Candidatus Buchananbacteria bacterium]|nr:4Fe-4S dicluster domain-containing protein [Candidatus Buchananbacteria bacterium]